MRPGRFDYLIYVSPPDLTARRDIFKIYLSSTFLLIKKVFSNHKLTSLANLWQQKRKITQEQRLVWFVDKR